jgi:chemotaxis protein methyltransferase CheR
MKLRQPQSSPPAPADATPNRRPPLLAPDAFGRLRDLLAAFSGVYLDSARQLVLEHGLAQRLQATGDDLSSYERRLQAKGGRDELHQLAELVLNHETFFFRNLPHMHALREALLPELHRRKPAGAPIGIWSAGCATGEEAYSLAMIALEALGQPLPRPVEIWATDLSYAALRKARAGVYRGRAIGNLPPELQTRYLRRQGDAYTVAESVRALVRFEFLNLLEPFPAELCDQDIIFCQNVTIYFQLETCRQLIERFYNCLPNGGLLFLGFSETLWNVFDRLRSREVAGAYVYYKESEKLAPPIEARKGAARTADRAARPDGRTAGTKPLVVPTTKEEPKTTPRVSRYAQRSFHDQAPLHPAHVQAGEEAMRRGRELLELGQAAEALEALSHVSPQSAYARQALTLTARAHADRGDLDLAVAEIHRALELDTLNEEAYFLLGMI